MPRVKRRIFAGAVCEQQVYTISDRAKSIKKAKPKKPRFKSEAEREKFNFEVAKREHRRKFNANFSPTSFFSTLTFDVEEEVHDFPTAKKIRDNYYRRLQYACPDARIAIYMGRGKSTHRIHFHMVSDGIAPEIIQSKWNYGPVVRIERLRAHNYTRDGKYIGQCYDGLADYLFKHWEPEQGKGSYHKISRNMKPPEREDVAEIKREYSPSRPPIAPKGYIYIGHEVNQYGFLCFKYVREPAERPPDRRPKGGRLKT